MELKKFEEEGTERIAVPLDNLLVELNIKEVRYPGEPAKVLAELKAEIMESVGWVKWEGKEAEKANTQPTK